MSKRPDSKSKRTIRKQLNGLRSVIDHNPDPIEQRMAYAIETAVRYVTEETWDWENLTQQAHAEANLLKEELAGNTKTRK